MATVIDSDVRALEARGAELAGVMHAAAAGLVAVIAEALASGVWCGPGIVSPEQWAGLRFGLSPHRARRMVASARGLVGLDAVRAAFAAGELSEDQVAEIARAGVTAAHDGEVVQLARHASVAQLRHALIALPVVDAPPAEPDAAPPDPSPPPRRRYAASHHRDDGGWELHAQAGAAEGALVDKALARAITKLYQARHGTTSEDTPRGDVAAIDALVYLAQLGLEVMDPATRDTPGRRPGERYVVNIHMPADRPDGARIHLGPVLPPELRRELCCDALVRAWITDEHGAVNLGRITRVVPPELRTVVEHRDGGCRVPGCDRTRWLRIHHIWHWEDGGPTDTANLIAVCGAHHRAIHRDELTITGNADQTLHFRDAHGRTFGPAPPRPPTTPLAEAAHQLGLHPRWTNRAGERAQWRYFNWTEPPPTPN